MSEATTPQDVAGSDNRLAWALVLSAGAVILGLWLALTPEGLFGKADAIGYAICHRIDLRSFNIDGRPLPLCARCTGIYLGALGAVLTLAGLGHFRSGALPSRPMLVVLAAFIASMGLDGANSYVGFFRGVPQLYEPNNVLRLITGTLCGVAVGSLIFPVFNQLWGGWQLTSVLSRWHELVALVAMAAVVVLLVLTGRAEVLTPLALLSVAGVLMLLTMLYTAGVLMISRRDGRLFGWRQAALPLSLGFVLAMAHIAAIDAVRYAVFGTWAGFPLGG